MKVKARAKPKLPQMDPGVYMAVCIGVVDLGEQYSEKFKNYSNKVLFIFEFPEERVEVDGEDKPRWMSREFTISQSKKSKLFEFVGSWNGVQYTAESFGEVELFDQIGKPCQLQLVTSESGEYTNIAAVMQLPKGVKVERKETDTYAFDTEEWDDSVFERLPDWIRERIMKSTQYQNSHAPTDAVDFPEEDEQEEMEPETEPEPTKREGVPF